MSVLDGAVSVVCQVCDMPEVSVYVEDGRCRDCQNHLRQFGHDILKNRLGNCHVCIEEAERED